MEIKIINQEEKSLFNDFMAWGPKGHVLQSYEMCIRDRLISERHRHRYEFNNDYREALTSCGMVFSGICPENDFVEIIELKDHPWFLGTLFHPEFKSRPNNPHPLFRDFLKAALSV